MYVSFGAIPDSTGGPRDPPSKEIGALLGSSARTVRSVHKQGNCHVELAPRKRWVVRSPEHPMAHNRVFQAAGVEAVRALCSPSRGVGIGPTSGPCGQLPAQWRRPRTREVVFRGTLIEFNRANPSKTGWRAVLMAPEMLRSVRHLVQSLIAYKLLGGPVEFAICYPV